jgi:hypothetical protein
MSPSRFILSLSYQHQYLQIMQYTDQAIKAIESYGSVAHHLDQRGI